MQQESVLSVPAENARKSKIQKMLDGIEFWYNNYGAGKGFDPGFVQTMARLHARGGRLSDKQYNAIERIYLKWVKV